VGRVTRGNPKSNDVDGFVATRQDMLGVRLRDHIRCPREE